MYVVYVVWCMVWCSVCGAVCGGAWCSVVLCGMCDACVVCGVGWCAWCSGVVRCGVWCNVWCVRAMWCSAVRMVTYNIKPITKKPTTLVPNKARFAFCSVLIATAEDLMNIRIYARRGS